MNPEQQSTPGGTPAETQLDAGVERLREIDKETHELQTERQRVADNVHKLREGLARKLDDAISVVEGHNPPAAPRLY